MNISKKLSLLRNNLYQLFTRERYSIEGLLISQLSSDFYIILKD